jgi:hypothetical protein
MSRLLWALIDEVRALVAYSVLAIAALIGTYLVWGGPVSMVRALAAHLAVVLVWSGWPG